MTASPTNSNDALKFWLSLECAQIKAAKIIKILKCAQNWEMFVKLDSSQLADLKLTNDEKIQIKKSFQSPQKSQIDRENQILAWLEDPKHHLVMLGDSHYPQQLLEIADPPKALFVRGKVELLNSIQIAIVGSRHASPIGKDIAYNFANILSQNQFTITSGLAYGIDAASHRGALQGRGNTIAVLGTGVNLIYPAAHQALADEIVTKDGAIISEFWLDTPPKAFHFPRRNRLISGLSLGVIVVEASLRSGSLVTAKLAVEQGREVFAVPGSVYNPNSRGTHALIKQGAKLVESIEDIIEEFKHFVPTRFETQINDVTSQHMLKHKLSDIEKTVLDSLAYDPINQEDLLTITGLSIDVLSSALIRLELFGLINKSRFGFARAATAEAMSIAS